MKVYKVKVNGKVYEVELEAVNEVAGSVSAPAPQAQVPVQSNGNGTKVVAPMQGTLLKLNVSVGQAVKKGQNIAVLEAMKLENEIVAPVDGTVTQIVASQGAKVNNGDTLLIIG